MVKREQIVNRAKELIAQHPLLGKDAINKRLQAEFGHGLRRIEVAKLKRKTISPIIREQVLTIRRYQSLKHKDFLPEEAEYYSQFPLRHAGMQKLIRQRTKESKDASEHGITQKRFPNYIRNSYLVKGFIDKQGRIDVIARAHKLADELMKPLKKREPLVIPPERYDSFLNVTKQKITPKDAFHLISVIPITRLRERLNQLRTLREYHFSLDEALQIVTAMTVKDKEGKQYLQKLDLTNPYWIQCMDDRVRWFNDMMKHFTVKEKMTAKQAINAIMRELYNYYAKDKKRRPWDWLSDFSPTKGKGARKEVDFIDSAKKRQDRIDKKKMPYRAVRSR